jgi:hypothetical protein
MRHRIRAASIPILFLLLLFFAAPAQADVAPPAQPPGGSIGPGEPTQVQMLAETVEVTVQPMPYAGEPQLVDKTTQAKVKASFTMHNLGNAGEKMQVRFPLMDPSGMGDGFGNYPEIQDIQVRVNEKLIPTARITTPTPNTWDKNAPPIAWAAFDVSFPPDKNMAIDVSYTLKPTGYYPVAEFRYILETGAGWRGPIGSADILLRLPYDATPQNVIQGENTSTPGGGYAGNEVRWHYENLEPTAQDNWSGDVVTPGLWQAILDARAAVQSAQPDATAWRLLADTTDLAAQDKSGKGWLREDDAGRRLADESAKAYEKTISLVPDDPGLHAAYAELLWRIILQYKYPTADSQPGPGDATLQRLVDEINSTLKLDPKNEQAQSLSDWIQGTYPEIVSVTDAGRLTLATPASASQTVPTSTPAQPSPPVSTATVIHIATSAPTLVATAIPSTPTIRPVSPTALPATTTQPAPSTPDRPIAPPGVFVAGGVVVILVLLGGVLALVWWLSHKS